MLTLTVRPDRQRPTADRTRRDFLGIRRSTEVAVWVVGLVAVATTATIAWGPIGVAIGAALAPAVAAAVVDRRRGRLPDHLVFGSAAITAVAAIGATAAGSSPITAMGAGVAVMALPVLALHLVLPEGMGFGDVKLAASLGALIGLVDWRLAWVVLALASGTSLIVAIARRRSAVAFGPALVVATGTVVVAIATLDREVAGWR